ncbi:MAG: late competence development ComFB family protein [Pseudohongiellaceae bacterium]|nr:late competence development ComFB family protein [Pseudohongiellaceae bacterium]
MHGNRYDRNDIGSDIDSIHNYYEKLVVELLIQNQATYGISLEAIPDLACVALNRLPPRYIRHDVDMAFYLSPDEYLETEKKVEEAVTEAVEFVKRRKRSESE